MREKLGITQKQAAVLMGYSSQERICEKERGAATETRRDRIMAYLWIIMGQNFSKYDLLDLVEDIEKYWEETLKK